MPLISKAFWPRAARSIAYHQSDAS